jgi:Ca-activated chloride channel family protein
MGMTAGGILLRAQDGQHPIFRVKVDMVVLSFQVTDSKNHYINGLKPTDFKIYEDGILQRVSTFAEGANTPVAVSPDGTTRPMVDAKKEDLPGMDKPDAFVGANVFVLFDTSNYMYRGFVFAQDAIADFVRSLESANKVAFYSYSRDLSRAALLTSDRAQVLRAARTTVAGDDAALYNCLLMTVQDAAHFTGRKVIVVFSNGPDNYSMVPPEDVAELAQSTGTTIYMVSTVDAHLEPISNAVFQRMTAATGGKVYFAHNWKDEQGAFASIRDDLAHLYSLSYYPKPNPNRGWRTITVKLASDQHKRYHIRTRDGYRLQRTHFSTDAVVSVQPEPAAK